MSDDLISRRAVLDNLEKHREMWDKDLTGDLYHSSEVIAMINEVPTVDERPHGEWKGNNFDEHSCPLCGHPALYEEEPDGYYEVQSNFCPNCGADMRKEEKKSE